MVAPPFGLLAPTHGGSKDCPSTWTGYIIILIFAGMSRLFLLFRLRFFLTLELQYFLLNMDEIVVQNSHIFVYIFGNF
jgi:hypothetical protein